MATIAEFAVPTRAFALAETLPDFPEVAVEADRIAAHVPDSTMPCLWASNVDDPEFIDAVAADRTVEEVEGTVDIGREQLYHVTWSDEVDQFVTEMIDHQGVVLEASGRDEKWLLRIRFTSREQLERFQSHFDDSDPPVRLERLFEARHPRHTRGRHSRAARGAHGRRRTRILPGTPRRIDTGVANALDVSDQAVSERIRRGTENLVQDMLTVEPIQDR